MPGLLLAAITSGARAPFYERYLIAGAVCLIVTSLQLANTHRIGPFIYRPAAAGESLRIPWKPAWASAGWWLALCGADIIVAIVGLIIASQTGSGSAGDIIGWVSIGALGPLGLRSPVWNDVTIRTRKVENPGLLILTDLVRQTIVEDLDDSMTEVKRVRKQAVVDAAMANTWNLGTFIAAAVQYVLDLTNPDPDEKQRVLSRFKLFADKVWKEEREAIEGLVEVALDERCKQLIKRVRSSRPSPKDIRMAADILTVVREAEPSTIEAAVAAIAEADIPEPEAEEDQSPRDDPPSDPGVLPGVPS